MGLYLDKVLLTGISICTRYKIVYFRHETHNMYVKPTCEPELHNANNFSSSYRYKRGRACEGKKGEHENARGGGGMRRQEGEGMRLASVTNAIFS